MQPPEITLDDKHIYRVNGNVVPGVNEILEKTGLVPPYLGDPWYGERGTAIHRCCHLLDMDDLDESTVDPAICGYVEAYRRFRAEIGMLPLLDIKSTDSTEPLTLELYAELIRVNRREYEDWEFVSETKLYHPLYKYCGTPDRWMPGGTALEGFFLRLKEEGTYTVKPYRLNNAQRAIALSAVTIYHERKRRGTL